jgi:hypothetical protein
MTDPDLDPAYDVDPEVDPDPDELDQPDPAVEQALPFLPVDLPPAVHTDAEVDEADALDQARTVELDDDQDEP